MKSVFRILAFLAGFRFHEGWIPFVLDPAETRVRDGHLTLPEGAGLGVEIDQAMLAPFEWARFQ